MHLVDLSPMETGYESLYIQAKYVNLTTRIAELRAMFEAERGLLTSQRVWLISSTEKGGGVAEMMPRIISMMRELHMKVEWLILDVADAAERDAFFALTKQIHNNIHGVGAPVDPNQRDLYERVNDANAAEFFSRFLTDPDPSRDVICLHDPQPAGMIAAIKRRNPGLRCIWRSHIGLDSANDASAAAWRFLEPYVTAADACVFSAREYIPRVLRDRSFIVHPGIAPLAPKNKELTPYEVTQLLMRAGLMNVQRDLLCEARGCELADAPFAKQAVIHGTTGRRDALPLSSPLPPAGEPSSASEEGGGGTGAGGLLLPKDKTIIHWDSHGNLHVPEHVIEDGIMFLNRPVVTQVKKGVGVGF